MSKRLTRFGLGIGAALVAIGLAAGISSANQDTSANQPPFMGGRMGRGSMGPGGPGGPGGMGPMGMLGPIQRLGLTDAQRNQVQTIMESHAEEFKALAERARTARLALHEAVTADPVQDAAVRQKSAEAAAVEADLAVAHAHARAEVMRILTDEQREELKKWTADRQERRGAGGPGGPGGRGQGRRSR